MIIKGGIIVKIMRLKNKFKRIDFNCFIYFEVRYVYWSKY